MRLYVVNTVTGSHRPYTMCLHRELRDQGDVESSMKVTNIIRKTVFCDQLIEVEREGAILW